MPIDVSIVIPIFDEEESIHPLCSSIRQEMATAGLDYEVILVDDGSRDQTFEMARAEAERESNGPES